MGLTIRVFRICFPAAVAAAASKAPSGPASLAVVAAAAPAAAFERAAAAAATKAPASPASAPQIQIRIFLYGSDSGKKYNHSNNDRYRFPEILAFWRAM